MRPRFRLPSLWRGRSFATHTLIHTHWHQIGLAPTSLADSGESSQSVIAVLSQAFLSFQRKREEENLSDSPIWRPLSSKTCSCFGRKSWTGLFLSCYENSLVFQQSMQQWNQTDSSNQNESLSLIETNSQMHSPVFLSKVSTKLGRSSISRESLLGFPFWRVIVIVIVSFLDKRHNQLIPTF